MANDYYMDGLPYDGPLDPNDPDTPREAVERDLIGANSLSNGDTLYRLEDGVLYIDTYGESPDVVKTYRLSITATEEG